MPTASENPKPSARAAKRDEARKQRIALARQDQDLFEMIACGYSYEQVAKEMRASVATLRRRVDRAIVARKLDAPHKYMHFQVARLNKALELVTCGIEHNDLKAVEPLMKLVDRLDRYHGLACLSRLSPRVAPPDPMALTPPPLALSHAKPALPIAEPDPSE